MANKWGTIAMIGVIGYAIYAVTKGGQASADTATVKAAENAAKKAAAEAAVLRAKSEAAVITVKDINAGIADVAPAQVGTRGYEYNDWLVFTPEGRAAMDAYNNGGQNPLIPYNAAVKANLQGRTYY